MCIDVYSIFFGTEPNNSERIRTASHNLSYYASKLNTCNIINYSSHWFTISAYTYGKAVTFRNKHKNV